MSDSTKKGDRGEQLLLVHIALLVLAIVIAAKVLL